MKRKTLFLPEYAESNSRPTTEEEDDQFRGEELANADLSRTDEFGLSNTTLQAEDLQSMSLCVNCNIEQVQIMTVPCRHLTVCERCSESILVTKLSTFEFSSGFRCERYSIDKNLQRKRTLRICIS